MIGNNKQSGFTLIESLVSVAIFSIAISVIATVFFNTNNLQQRTKNLQQVQNEGRYILDKLAKEIRAREIDEALVNNQSLFFKEDEFGEVLGFFYDSEKQNLMISSQVGQDLLSASLNSNSIAIKDIDFSILTLDSETDEFRQPLVIVRLVLENRSGFQRYYQELRLQTAISSKFYK